MNFASKKLLSFSGLKCMASEEMNSEKVMSEPQRRAIERMAISDTPDMGAKAITGLLIVCQEKDIVCPWYQIIFILTKYGYNRKLKPTLVKIA